MDTPVSTKKKVLLVDDDKFLLDMYALKFSKSGYEVRTADATDSGLKLLREGYAPDIMLFDIVMPGMDGLELADAVRKENLAPPHSALIMLTNQGDADDISRAKKIEVDGYIVKATTIPSEVLAESEKILAGKNK